MSKREKANEDFYVRQKEREKYVPYLLGFGVAKEHVYTVQGADVSC